MTEIGAALREHVLGDAGIVAIVVDRMYPVKPPQKAVMPCLSYFRVTDLPVEQLHAAPSAREPLFQVDTWATSWDTCVELAGLVKRRLFGTWTWNNGEAVDYTVQIRYITGTDGAEEDINGGVWRHRGEYRVFHGTAGDTI